MASHVIPYNNASAVSCGDTFFGVPLLNHAKALSRTCSSEDYQKTRDLFFELVFHPKFPLSTRETDAVIRKLDLVGLAFQKKEKVKLECLAVYIFIKSIFNYAKITDVEESLEHPSDYNRLNPEELKKYYEAQNALNEGRIEAAQKLIEDNFLNVNQIFPEQFAEGLMVSLLSMRLYAVAKVKLMFRAGANLNGGNYDELFWNYGVFHQIDLLRESFLCGLDPNLGLPTYENAGKKKKLLHLSQGSVQIDFSKFKEKTNSATDRKSKKEEPATTNEKSTSIKHQIPPMAALVIIDMPQGLIPDFNVELRQRAHGLRLALFWGLKINAKQRWVLQQIVEKGSPHWIERLPHILNSSEVLKKEAEDTHRNEFRVAFTANPQFHSVFTITALASTFFDYAYNRERVLEIYEKRYGDLDQQTAAHKDKATVIEIE